MLIGGEVGGALVEISTVPAAAEIERIEEIAEVIEEISMFLYAEVGVAIKTVEETENTGVSVTIVDLVREQETD